MEVRNRKYPKGFLQEQQRAQKARAIARYYQLNSILGNDWAMFYCILGARKTGKSYSVADFLCNQKRKYGDKVKNYWMRISDTSIKAMLANGCVGLIDPDIQRKYNLDLKARGGMYVLDHGKDFMITAPLSSFGKLKGVGFYDKDYNGWYNIVLDEFQLEQGEKRTSFDLLYNFIGMCENLVRTTKSKIRVFLLGNTLEEASTILKAFNFLPQKFGRFYLRSKRCVIDNLEPTEEYLKDRYGSISDILGGGAMSNYTNELCKDIEQISKERLRKPQGVIRFNKGKDTWFTIWDDWVITRWQGKRKANGTYADGVMFADDAMYWVMRPHLQGKGIYQPERRQTLIDMYNVKAIKFKDLITQSYFNDEMKKLKPNG